MDKFYLKKSANPKNKFNFKGFLKNPLFYFGGFSFILLLFLFFGSSSSAKGGLGNGSLFFGTTEYLSGSDLFFGQNETAALEAPDLKIIQDNFIYGISTPRILTTRTLGDIFGESSDERKDIEYYIVEPEDTMAKVAAKSGISKKTLALANNISENSPLQVGQELVILPVDGVLYVVKSGDTVSEIGRRYKAKVDDIISFNNLLDEGDIFIGDLLIIPGGVMPPKPVPSIQVALPNSFFIYPAEGRITQGLHYYNAVDLANKCGTPIHASTSGTVQRVGFDQRYGNYMLINGNGIGVYYGHWATSFVKSGDNVTLGDRIALMGNTGTKSTGCHLHIDFRGAKNPFNFPVGTELKYK